MNTPTPETDAFAKSVHEGRCLPSCDSFEHDEHCPYANGEPLLADFARKLERERDAWIAFADYMQTNGELRTANLYEAHELRRFAEESKGSR